MPRHSPRRELPGNAAFSDGGGIAVPVHDLVMSAAQHGRITELRFAACPPRDDVVHFAEARWSIAAGKRTALISYDDSGS